MTFPIFCNKNREATQTFYSVGVGATLDFELLSTPNLYMVTVNDNSNNSLGAAWLYIGSNTLKINLDSTTGGLMTGACPPTIATTNANGDGILRFTNATTARKISVLAMWPTDE
jgi:hypothetical protein